MLASTSSDNNSELINNLIAKEYVNQVKENRSLYGSYVDNALAFDPNKESNSMYNVVYETESDNYFPWGERNQHKYPPPIP
jgi:hypothetical protein